MYVIPAYLKWKLMSDSDGFILHIAVSVSFLMILSISADNRHLK